MFVSFFLEWPLPLAFFKHMHSVSFAERLWCFVDRHLSWNVNGHDSFYSKIFKHCLPVTHWSRSWMLEMCNKVRLFRLFINLRLPNISACQVLVEYFVFVIKIGNFFLMPTKHLLLNHPIRSCMWTKLALIILRLDHLPFHFKINYHIHTTLIT